ncbi:MAG: hypothetical protein SWC96_05055 [Thermodesulfobacteriota bacterium]|nr:hypothetical protein [Thermodesulfobacteriota bacterium]
MIPIYFPFSVLSDRTMARLVVCFPVMGIYLPAESAREPVLGLCGQPEYLETRVPAADLDGAVEDLYRAAIQWKEATLGADMSFVKTWEKGRAPFFDETTISYVRNEILRQKSAAATAADDLVEAKLFMRLALDHDLGEAEVARGVGALEAREKTIFDTLRGEGGDDDDLSREVLGLSVAGPAEDAGTRMTGQRMRAWAMVAARDTLPSAVFITDSEAVMAHIETCFPSMAPVTEIPGIPFLDAVTDPLALKDWQGELSDFLEKLARGRGDEILPAPAAFFHGGPERSEAVLSLFVLPDTGPRAFFEFFAARVAGHDDVPNREDIKNIIIGRLKTV